MSKPPFAEEGIRLRFPLDKRLPPGWDILLESGAGAA
jgi:hypothetical protein